MRKIKSHRDISQIKFWSEQKLIVDHTYQTSTDEISVPTLKLSLKSKLINVNFELFIFISFRDCSWMFGFCRNFEQIV